MNSATEKEIAKAEQAAADAIKMCRRADGRTVTNTFIIGDEIVFVRVSVRKVVDVHLHNSPQKNQQSNE